jgi:hypothetical protein
MRRARIGRPLLYDWDKLIAECFKGIEHDYESGKDFACTPMSFGALVRRTARVRGLSVNVSVDGDHVYFYFLKND